MNREEAKQLLQKELKPLLDDLSIANMIVYMGQKAGKLEGECAYSPKTMEDDVIEEILQLAEAKAKLSLLNTEEEISQFIFQEFQRKKALTIQIGLHDISDYIISLANGKEN